MIDTRTSTGRAAFAAALAVIAIGASVLIGWLFGLDVLTRIGPGFVAMNPVTAVAFILSGASLSLFLVPPRSDRRRTRALSLTARVLAFIVALIGLARLGAIAGGWDLGVGRWLFSGAMPEGFQIPVPMAANTALNFLLLGGVLPWVDATHRSARFAADSIALAVSLGSLLTVLAYAYDVQSFYHLGAFTPMALHTAVAFALLGIAVLLSHTDHGVLAVFAGDSVGGTAARRLLAAAVVVPAVLGWLARQGENAGIYRADFGLAVFAIGNIAVFTFLVSWNARSLFSAGTALRESQRFLRSTLDALSSHVAILDEHGTIIEVNDAWDRFARDNNAPIGHCGVGENYLGVSDAAGGKDAGEAAAAAGGIRAVMAGQRAEFLLEYPCDSPRERRWFLMRVTRFAGTGPVRTVVAHANITERRRAEDELRWKTAFLEAQVNSSIDGILVVDERGRKLQQNERAAELLRIPRHIAEDQDDEQQLRWVTGMMKNPAQFIEKVGYLNTHQNEVSRDEIELTDGTVLDRYSAPVRGGDGRYFGRIWTFRDVTARKRMENALRESDEKFHQLADHITDAFWIRSPDMHQVQYVSPAFERIWGRSVESLHAHPEQWTDFIVPEDRERVQRAFAALKTDGDSVDVEYRITRPDGDIRWVHVRGFQVRDAASAVIRHVGIVTDITEHKRLDDARRESEERFRNFFDLGLIGMAVTSPAKGCLDVNDRICEILGYDRRELLQMSWATFTHADDLIEETARFDQMLAGRSDGYSMDKRYIRKDGQIVYAAVSVKCVRRADGSVDYVLALVQDITERKRLEAQLVQSQKLETVGKLAGGVAHEFNSILTTIIGQTELVLAELPAGSPMSRNVTEISHAATRAATLTRQLLAYGRKQMLRPEHLDLNAVLVRMETTVRHVMGRSTEVRVVPAPGLHAVKADAGQIEQVIMNMVMNAGDAMPHGGTLTLQTANVELDQTEASRFPDLKAGAYAVLAISDTGTGMSEAVTSHLFEPFFTTKGVGQGTGLGLSTCYGIIRQSGGHISVESEPGRGTTFRIYLPQSEPPMDAPVQRLDSPDLPRGTETILLVESDPTLREMATALLSRLGYTVLEAADGIEAQSVKQRLGTGRIDIVFNDGVKPFTPSALAHRLRALLDERRA